MSSASNRQLKLQKQLATDVFLEYFCKHLLTAVFFQSTSRKPTSFQLNKKYGILWKVDGINPKVGWKETILIRIEISIIAQLQLINHQFRDRFT